MAVDGGCGDTGDWEGRWNHVKKFLERSGPFTHPDFEPSTESLQFLLDICKVLVIGAGGLGCELLKNLVIYMYNTILLEISKFFCFLSYKECLHFMIFFS